MDNQIILKIYNLESRSLESHRDPFSEFEFTFIKSSI